MRPLRGVLVGLVLGVLLGVLSGIVIHAWIVEARIPHTGAMTRAQMYATARVSANARGCDPVLVEGDVPLDESPRLVEALAIARQNMIERGATGTATETESRGGRLWGVLYGERCS